MKAIAAFFIFALCNSVTLVQSGRCWGIIWNNGCYGIGWKTAKPLGLLTDIADKIVEGSRQSLPNLHVDKIDLGEIGSIEDVTFKNLETFEVTNLELGKILALEIKNLSVVIDVLSVEGSYNLISLDVPLIGNISGSGSFSVDLKNVSISASLSFAPEGLTKIVVKNINNIRVDIDAALAVLDEVQGSDAVDDALSAIIPNAVKEAVPQLLESNKQAIINFLNNILN